jgi:hypothetical protein
MPLSHEKIVHLSHLIADALDKEESASFQVPHNQVRLEILEALRRELSWEEELERRARAKIESMKRSIAEGSPEWDILYSKFYEEERDKRRRLR